MPTITQLKKLIKELDPKARIHGPRKDELERIYECLKRGGDVKTVYKEVKNEVRVNAPIYQMSVPQLRVAIKNIDFEASVWKLVRSELEDKLKGLRLWREYSKQLPLQPELEYGEKYKPRTINEEIDMIKNMLEDKDNLEIHKGKMTTVRSEFKIRVKKMGGKRQLMRECKLDKTSESPSINDKTSESPSINDQTEEQNQHYINRQVAIKLKIYYHQKQLRMLSENLDSIYEEDSVREISV